jgi:hypothetical protein
MWSVAWEGRPAQAGTPGLALATKVTGKPGWRGVAAYTDQYPGDGRPGLPLLGDAPEWFDLFVVDVCARLSSSLRGLHIEPR